ncbi:hypothetical protein QUB33_26975 [Microcoleus sp. B3-A4]|uniref:hypothetical protein n=1 Tax=Microcoleus sp. B3-A4 TaxID=2818653 RepID=UPI002FD4759C
MMTVPIFDFRLAEEDASEFRRGNNPKSQNPEKGTISRMAGRKCARVFQKHQHPLRQRLADVGNSLKSTAQSVFNIQ